MRKTKRMTLPGSRGGRLGRRWRQRQAGQALTETLVASIVLIPLLLLVILLGKFQSVQQATIAASRTMIFECTVRIDDCRRADPTLIEEVRQRHFAAPGLPLRTEARVTNADAAAQRQSLWVDARNRSLLERFEHVGASIDEQSSDGAIETARANTRSVGALAARALIGDGPERFGFDTTAGMFVARVDVDLSASRGAADFTSQLLNLRWRPRAQAAIVVDGWHASGPYGEDWHSVTSRVDEGRRLPGGADGMLDFAIGFFRPFMWLMDALGLDAHTDDFRPEHIDVDLVPADRLP